MWKFGGEIEFSCENCSTEGNISVDDFSIECIGGSERGMGDEYIHEISVDINCIECGNEILLSFEASEYPINLLNFITNNSEGATTSNEPVMVYLEEIYHAEDLAPVIDAISELIEAIKVTPEKIRKITPRDFEEIIAAIFRKKEFSVELTQKTRDGGKDIIAISTDKLGIKVKYFIECKHYAENNKVDVNIVRALHGVKHQKDGPNKTIVVTTSSFTRDAKKFVENEISSNWDMSLADYDQVIQWIQEH
jgi:HJR/Mrr/RecB family endonuclease